MAKAIAGFVALFATLLLLTCKGGGPSDAELQTAVTEAIEQGYPHTLCAPANVNSVELVERGTVLKGTPPMMPAEEVWPARFRATVACRRGGEQTADLEYWVFRDSYGKWQGLWTGE